MECVPAVGPVEISRSNEVELGVDPVDLVHDDVEGEAVGPSDGLGDDDGSVRPVHSGALDFRILAPIRPEHPAVIEKAS